MMSKIFLGKRSFNSLNLSYDAVDLMLLAQAQNAKEIKFYEKLID